MTDKELLDFLESRNELNDELKDAINNNDYEFYEDAIDLIAVNTGLTREDVENVLQFADWNENSIEDIYKTYMTQYGNSLDLGYYGIIYY